MKSIFHKTLALTLSVSMLAAYTPGFAAERLVITNDTPSEELAISGENFSDITVANDGAAIKINLTPNDDKWVTVSNSTFTNNVADYSGSDSGAISISNGKVAISNSTFTGNKAQGGWAGAIYAYTGNKAGVETIITDSLFENNEAPGIGAVGNFSSQRLLASGGMTLDNVTFRSNKATDSTEDGGGAMFLGSESHTSIANSSFEENTSAAVGGAIATRVAINASGSKNDNSAAELDITKTTFTGNTAATTGGAIDNYLYGSTQQNGSVYVADSTFENNSAADGGAIYNHGETDLGGNMASLTVEGGTFTGNTASKHGGAIYNAGTLDVTNGTFANNQAAQYGGALYVNNLVNSALNDGTTTIADSTFDANHAYLGGAMFLHNGTVTIKNTTFTNNTADYSGAIFTSSSPNLRVSVEDSIFENNTAKGAGAVQAMTTFTINNSQFRNNASTEDEDGGGALFIGAVGNLSLSGNAVENSVFENNTSATRGGAISTRGTNANNADAIADIVNTSFKGNVAGTTGGAFDNYLYGSKNAEGSVYLANDTFENNSAANGGAIYNHSELDTNNHAGVITVKDSTFAGNSASEKGGAIYNANVVTLAGTNTFTGNTAAEGADIYNAGTLTINDTTTIDGGIAGDGTVNVNGTLNIGQAEVKAGTLAFANGSTLGVEFGNDTMGNLKANTITVGENASDTAKLQVVLSKDFLTTDKTEHSLTNDTAVTNGKFAMADVTNALYNVSFDDSTNIVTAQRKSQEEQQEAVENVGGTANDVAVTAAFTSASDLGNDTTNKVADIINTLAQTDTAALVEVTKAVAPEVAPAKQVVHTAVLNEVFGALQHRMADASTASPAMYALGDAKNYNTANAKHFSVWTQGLLNKSHKEATSDTHAFTGRSTGIAAGADMKVGESGLVGLGYAYTHTNVSSTGRHDRILGDNFFLYGQYRPSAFYVQGSMAYGDSKYEESKYLPGMTLDANYHVQHYAMQGRVGYDVTDWFSPNMGLRYTRLHQEGYSDGAQNVAADNANYFTGMLGADFQTEQRLSQHVSLLPHLYTGLSYDFKSDDNNSRVTLPNATGYNVTGERLHRLAFEVGAGVTARLYHSVEMMLGYEGSFRQDYNSHTGTLKLRYLF